MIDETPNLGLPCLHASQADKHVTVNAAFARLDATVQPRVASASVTDQPADPDEGDAYILPHDRTGPDWSTMPAGAIARRVDGAWTLIEPAEGWTMRALDTGVLLVRRGGVWTADVDGSRRNLLVNAGMSVHQRGVASCADGTYGLDRWCVLTESAAVGVARIDPVEPGPPNAQRLTQTAATPQRFGVVQILEASETRRCRGGAVAASARVRASVACDVHLAVLAWTGAADEATRDVVAEWSASGGAASGFAAAGHVVLARAERSLTGGDAATLGSVVARPGGAVRNVTFAVWTSTPLPQGATLELWSPQLELADVATGPFEAEDPVEARLRCARFFQKSFPEDVAPASAAGLAGAVAASVNPYGYGLFDLPLTPRMRATPTVTLFDPAGSGATARNMFGSQTYALTNVIASDSRILASNGVPGAINVFAAVHYVLDAEI